MYTAFTVVSCSDGAYPDCDGCVEHAIRRREHAMTMNVEA